MPESEPPPPAVPGDGSALSQLRPALPDLRATIEQHLQASVTAAQLLANYQSAREQAAAQLSTHYSAAQEAAQREQLANYQRAAQEAAQRLSEAIRGTDIRLEDLRTAASWSPIETATLRAIRARAAELGRRRGSLASWHSVILEQVREAGHRRWLYLQALAGDRQALADVRRIAESTARHPSGAGPNLLTVQTLALMEALEELGGAHSELAHRVRVLLVAVVLAPEFYLWRHTQPRDLLRGSLEPHSPPANRAALPLRALASVVGDPSRTSPP